MPVPKRIATVILNALKGGVVPRIGLGHIAVGRTAEISALLHDIDMMEQGGAAFRFIVGKYGSGKSFLLQTIKGHAMDRGFAVADADLSPERRLCGTRGQGLGTYRELIKNLSVKARPEGGALPLILERWMDGIQTRAVQEEGLKPETPAFFSWVEKEIYAVIHTIETQVHGFDFAKLLAMYWTALQAGDDERKSSILKWFRGEYQTKREVRQELGVSVLITDDNWYEYIKLFSVFLVQAGYKGFLVLLDELVNIYKAPNTTTRQYNYEKMLSMYNDVLQGKANYLGIIMGGTPQCIEDTRRGVFSYEALRSRLAEGRFSSEGNRDLLAPIIRLMPLQLEEMVILVEKLLKIHSELYGYEPVLTEQDLIDFIQLSFGRVGSESHITPREVIRDFIELMNILYQHPEKKARDFISTFLTENTEEPFAGEDDFFAEFTV